MVLQQVDSEHVAATTGWPNPSLTSLLAISCSLHCTFLCLSVSILPLSTESTVIIYNDGEKIYKIIVIYRNYWCGSLYLGAPMHQKLRYNATVGKIITVIRISMIWNFISLHLQCSLSIVRCTSCDLPVWCISYFNVYDWMSEFYWVTTHQSAVLCVSIGPGTLVQNQSTFYNL